MPSSASQLTLHLLTLICTVRLTSAACDFSIRRSRVLNTWQSSHAPGVECFNTRSSQNEMAAIQSSTRPYFLSGNGHQAFSGFQLFAVQLKSAALIKSVTVKSREQFFKASTGIEVWASRFSGEVFSGDHCNSRDMADRFAESLRTDDRWKLCGVTGGTGSVTDGLKFRVECLALARHLVLRKNIEKSMDLDPTDNSMALSDLTLESLRLEVSAPQIVTQGSEFTVKCQPTCNGNVLTEDPALMQNLQLCSPDGVCSDEQMQRTVHNAQPHHSGTYICMLDKLERSASVSMISTNAPAVSVKNSNFTVSCSVHNGFPTLANNLQLCLPNGTCISSVRYDVISARPSDTGVYKCKLSTTTIEHQATVSLLSISAPQLVPYNSSFTVGCSLHIGDTDVSSDSNLNRHLQLCQPDGNCRNEQRVVIQSAQLQHSGLYKCRGSTGSAEIKQTVTVILTSAPEFVAVDAGFAVNCSLHCGAEQVCVGANQVSRIQLCSPSGNCIRQHKLQIASAQSRYSGIYTCKLDSVEHGAAVTVLYPPSNVSVQLKMHDSSCSASSNGTVTFSATASNSPVDMPIEHRCHAVADTGEIFNLKQTSFSANHDGSISSWTLTVANPNSAQRGGRVTCSAVQIWHGRFQTARNGSATWSCGKSHAATAASSQSTVITAVTVGLAISIGSIVALYGVLKFSVSTFAACERSGRN